MQSPVVSKTCSHDNVNTRSAFGETKPTESRHHRQPLSVQREHCIRTALVDRGTLGRMDLDMWWTVLKEAATKWSSHKDARQGAALAYYSVFSLSPIIVIAIAVAGLLFGHDAVTAQVMSSIKDMLGETGPANPLIVMSRHMPEEGLVDGRIPTDPRQFAT